MIRLTHQFDPPSTRATAASPKSSGGCCSCCCCCCVVTTLGASVITARSMRAIQAPGAGGALPRVGVAAGSVEPGVGTPSTSGEAASGGAQVATAGSGQPPARGDGPGFRLLAFFLLPVCVGLGFLLVFATGKLEVGGFALVAWIAAMVALVSSGRLSAGRAAGIVVGSLLLSLLEAFLWIKLVFGL